MSNQNKKIKNAKKCIHPSPIAKAARFKTSAGPMKADKRLLNKRIRAKAKKLIDKQLDKLT